MIKIDLSEVPIAPLQYRLAGGILLGIGILLLCIGLLLSSFTISRRAANSTHTKVSAEECVKKINALHLQSTVQGDVIRIQDDNLQRGMELLASSSQAAALCPNWMLADYCLGSACTPPGLTMSLKYSEKR